MSHRLLGAAAFILPAAFCVVWGLAAKSAMRGPAGNVAMLILWVPALGCLVMSFRVLTLRLAPKSFPVHGAALMNIVLIVLLLVFLPLVRSRYANRGERQTRTQLSVLRSAIVAHVKKAGKPPTRLSGLVPSRLPMLPLLQLPQTGHPATREVRLGTSKQIGDTGKWFYVNDSQDRFFGQVRIDCSHTDSRAIAWSAY
jgi:type II secretory pathway pseudopilin PulG